MIAFRVGLVTLLPMVLLFMFGSWGFFCGLIFGCSIIAILWHRKEARKKMLKKLLAPPTTQETSEYYAVNHINHTPIVPTEALRKESTSSKKITEYVPPRAPEVFISSPKSFRSETATSIRPPAIKKLQWIPQGSLLEIGGQRINGMIYTSETSLGWDGEPSAINLRLAIDARQGVDEEIPYYPSYEALSPRQRFFYLNWLASDRNSVNPNDLPTGYLFLFFYGLERRVLLEGDNSIAVWDEVLRLLKIYGLTRKSRSIPSYFGDFLHFTAYIRGQEYYASVLQKLLDSQGERLSETALILALAQRFRSSQPLDWRLGHLIAMGLEESRRSVVVKRTGDKFREMFATRYEEAFPNGIILKASKREGTVRYQTGNATLFPRYATASPFMVKIPSVMGMSSQFKPLAKIWNQCIEDLTGYSRAVGKITGASIANAQDLLSAYLALPDELRMYQTHPLKLAYQKAIESSPKEKDFTFVPLAVLASIMGIPERPILTQKQSDDLANLVESFGYTLAPHPTILNMPFAWGQEVAICVSPPNNSMPKGLGGLLRLLHLAVLVASADGAIDEAELNVFHGASSAQDDFTRVQISATEAVLIRDTNVAASRLQKIAKSIHQNERKAVFKLLVHIACADDVLSSDENRLLRRIAKAFQLSSSALEDVLSEDSNFETVTVSTGRNKTQGETIPRPTVASSFSLDMERIRSLTEETAEVVSILSRALEEEVTDDSEEPSSIDQSKTEISVQHPEWIASLDDRYKNALIEIITSMDQSNFDFDAIIDSHHLLPDDFIDGVNSWADESLGDFLIESDDDGDISINQKLIPNKL